MTQKKYLLYISKNYSFVILRALQLAILKRGELAAWYVEGSDINIDFFNDEELVLPSINAVNNWEPDAVFVPGNTVPHYIKGLKVAVFHGFNVEKRSDERGHFNIRGCFDLYCTQGPNTTKPFQLLAEKHAYFSVKETGWCALDEMYKSDINAVHNPIDTSAPLFTETKPTIILCSTFTTRLSCAEPLFETVKALSKTGKWNWLVQFHPKMAVETVAKYKALECEHLHYIETDNVIPYLQAADVMLCDTSSVITMFLLQNKPVVTFNNAAPKSYFIDVKSTENIAKSISQALTYPENIMTEIASFIKDTHPYDDGQSAERVLQAVDERLQGLHTPAKAKPRGLWRELKKRWEENYWRW